MSSHSLLFPSFLFLQDLHVIHEDLSHFPGKFLFQARNYSPNAWGTPFQIQHRALAHGTSNRPRETRSTRGNGCGTRAGRREGEAIREREREREGGTGKSGDSIAHERQGDW